MRDSVDFTVERNAKSVKKVTLQTLSRWLHQNGYYSGTEIRHRTCRKMVPLKAFEKKPDRVNLITTVRVIIVKSDKGIFEVVVMHLRSKIHAHSVYVCAEGFVSSPHLLVSLSNQKYDAIEMT